MQRIMQSMPDTAHLAKYQFKPGQSGNPAGKAKDLITRDKIKAAMSKYSSLSQEELSDIISNPKTQVFDAMIASIMRRVIKEGDAQRLDFLLNRMVGKVKEELEIQNNEEREQLAKLSLKELVIYAQKHLPGADNESGE